MKKLVQLAALLMVGLLVLAPAVAGLSCALGQRAICTADCPMATQGMNPGSSMGCQMAEGGCRGSCCSLKVPQAATVFAATERTRFTLSAGPNPIQLDAPQTEPAHVPELAIVHAAVSPRIYLLNRVFRI